MNWVVYHRTTNYPKLGYIIHKLNEAGIACRLNGRSKVAPILEIDAGREDDAWAIPGERFGRNDVDSMPDNHRRFTNYAHIKPRELS